MEIVCNVQGFAGGGGGGGGGDYFGVKVNDGLHCFIQPYRADIALIGLAVMVSLKNFL